MQAGAADSDVNTNTHLAPERLLVGCTVNAQQVFSCRVKQGVGNLVHRLAVVRFVLSYFYGRCWKWFSFSSQTRVALDQHVHCT